MNADNENAEARNSVPLATARLVPERCLVVRGPSRRVLWAHPWARRVEYMNEEETKLGVTALPV